MLSMLANTKEARNRTLSTKTENIFPRTRPPREHHTRQYQVTLTVSTEDHVDTPESAMQMLEVMLVENDLIRRYWTQATILKIDEVGSLD